MAAKYLAPESKTPVPLVLLIPVANNGNIIRLHLELRISPRIFEKFETAMVYLGNQGSGGKLIHEKNRKSINSWHCPFKRGFSKFPTLAASDVKRLG
jgi:hypothetical protein